MKCGFYQGKFNHKKQEIIHYGLSRHTEAYHHKNGRGGRNTPDLCMVPGSHYSTPISCWSIVVMIENVHTIICHKGGFTFGTDLRD